jgi:photosystem II stability/assembly factor-like uncharacterized protein
MQIRALTIHFAVMLFVLAGAPSISAAKSALSLARVPHIHVMVIDPVDPEKLLIATTKGLYRVGRDGILHALLDDKHEVAGFLISADGQRLLATGKKAGRGFGVMQSTNGGHSWYQRGIGLTPKFAMRELVNTDRHFKRLYAVSKVLAKSSDGGKSWTQIGPLPVGLIGLTAQGPGHDTLLAATAKGPRESVDGGVIWTPIKAGTEGRPASMIGRGAGGDVFTFVVKDGLYVRRGGGHQWFRVAPARAFDGALIRLVSDGKSRRRLIVLTQYMKILESRDGGRTWRKFRR